MISWLRTAISSRIQSLFSMEEFFPKKLPNWWNQELSTQYPSASTILYTRTLRNVSYTASPLIMCLMWRISTAPEIKICILDIPIIQPLITMTSVFQLRQDTDSYQCIDIDTPFANVTCIQQKLSRNSMRSPLSLEVLRLTRKR